VMSRGLILAGCETARLALSCCWTSSLLPTKSANHLDAVADNLDLPTEPATALLCARLRQDLRQKPSSRASIRLRESRIYLGRLVCECRLHQASSGPSTTAQDGSPKVASRGPLWSLGGGPPCLEPLITRPCRSLSVAPSAKASNCQRCLDAGTYSRSPKNPALQQLQKSVKSASTTPQEPIWNHFDKNGGYSSQGLRKAKNRCWPNQTAFLLRGLGRAGKGTVLRLITGARLSLGSGPKAHPKPSWMGNRTATTAPKNAHPKHVWMVDGLEWEWMGCASGRDDGSHSIKVSRHLCPQSKRSAARSSQLSPCDKACIHPSSRPAESPSAPIQSLSVSKTLMDGCF